MYANLAVEVVVAKTGRVTLYAHEVTFVDGRAVIHLDDPDDESSYASPVGTRVLNLDKVVSITASF